MKLISVVLPCLNESKNLPLLIPQIIKFIPQKYSYEIICIDDGSTDETPEVIIRLAKRNKKIKGIFFHRRFGHQSALRAGVEYTKGDAVIMMDSDFQHPPHLIPELIRLWEKGHDLVRTQKKADRHTSPLKRLMRTFGYRIWNAMTDGSIIPGGSDFRLISRSLAQYIINSQEVHIFLRGNVGLGSRNPTALKYKVEKRKFGKSSYSMRDLTNMFLNGFISFSPKPLRLAFFFGLFMIGISSILLLYDIVVAIISNRPIIEGWATVVLLAIFLNGFLIFYLGILGEYIGVIFREVKGRPKYLIDRTVNI